MTMPSDTDYMRRCLELAANGLIGAHPNPMVGCVIVREGETLGEGWHALCGEAHAEVNALAQAGGRARGATVYVSLEPCSHHGRTGPCSEALAAAGVSRVVYGMLDPNPVVAGRGVARLRDAGVTVEGPLLEEQAAALNPGFVKRMKQGLPYVRCKLAMSLDGRTAMASGESKWITGPEARADVQRWRARSGAVLTGVETVLADDPRLDARLEHEHLRQPLRVIVDSGLRTPVSARILEPPGEVLIATAVGNPQLVRDRLAEFPEPRPQVLSFGAGEGGRVALEPLLASLARERQCNDVLLESGARLAGAMMQAGLVDEVLAFVAPVLLGSDARPLFVLPGLTRMAERVELEFLEVAMLGKDVRMRARVVPSQEA